MKSFVIVCLIILIAVSILCCTVQSCYAQPDSLWSRNFGGVQYDECNSLIQTEDGGFALAGYTRSFGAGNADFWLVKTDVNGDSLWSRTYGGENNDVCKSLVQTVDGGYALAGRTDSFGEGGSRFWLVKTDANGDSLWSDTYHNSGSTDYCQSMIQTIDGGYALGGWTWASGGDDIWLVKTDVNGDSLWSRTFAGERTERCHSIIQTADSGLVVAGYTNSLGSGWYDSWLIKTDMHGNPLWSRTFGGVQWDICNAIIETTEGGFALAGYTHPFGMVTSDFWLVKIGSNPERVPSGNNFSIPSRIRILSAYPNPFNATTNLSYSLPIPSPVTIQICDVSGRLIETLVNDLQQAGQHSVTWNSRNASSGVYLVRMEALGFKGVRKVVLVR